MIKKLFCLLLAISLSVIMLAGCSSDNTADVKKGGDSVDYTSIYTPQELLERLRQTLGSSDSQGNNYTYEEYGTYTLEKINYYIFAQYKVSSDENNEPKKDYLSCYFISYDGTKAYKGTYNNQTSQAQFKETLNLQ